MPLSGKSISYNDPTELDALLTETPQLKIKNLPYMPPTGQPQPDEPDPAQPPQDDMAFLSNSGPAALTTPETAPAGPPVSPETMREGLVNKALKDLQALPVMTQPQPAQPNPDEQFALKNPGAYREYAQNRKTLPPEAAAKVAEAEQVKKAPVGKQSAIPQLEPFNPLTGHVSDITHPKFQQPKFDPDNPPRVNPQQVESTLDTYGKKIIDFSKRLEAAKPVLDEMNKLREEVTAYSGMVQDGKFTGSPEQFARFQEVVPQYQQFFEQAHPILSEFSQEEIEKHNQNIKIFENVRDSAEKAGKMRKEYLSGRQGVTVAIHDWNAAVGRGFGELFHELHNLSAYVNPNLSTPRADPGGAIRALDPNRKTVFENISKQFYKIADESSERGTDPSTTVGMVGKMLNEGIAKAGMDILLYQGLGKLINPTELKAIGGTGGKLLKMAEIPTKTYEMPAMGAIRGALQDQNQLAAAGLGGAEGALMQVAMHGAGQLPLGPREMMGGIIFGASPWLEYLKEPENQEKLSTAISSTLTGMGMMVHPDGNTWRNFLAESAEYIPKVKPSLEELKLHSLILTKLEQVQPEVYGRLMKMKESERTGAVRRLWVRTLGNDPTDMAHLQGFTDRKNDMAKLDQQITEHQRYLDANKAEMSDPEITDSMLHLRELKGRKYSLSAQMNEARISKGLTERHDLLQENLQQIQNVIPAYERIITDKTRTEEQRDSAIDGLAAARDKLKHTMSDLAEINADPDYGKALEARNSGRENPEQPTQREPGRPLEERLNLGPTPFFDEETVKIAENPLLNVVFGETEGTGIQKKKAQFNRARGLRDLKTYVAEILPDSEDAAIQNSKKSELAERLTNLVANHANSLFQSDKDEAAKPAILKRVLDNFGDALDAMGLGDDMAGYKQHLQDRIDALNTEKEQIPKLLDEIARSPEEYRGDTEAELELSKPILDEINSKRNVPAPIGTPVTKDLKQMSDDLAEAIGRNDLAKASLIAEDIRKFSEARKRAKIFAPEPDFVMPDFGPSPEEGEGPGEPPLPPAGPPPAKPETYAQRVRSRGGLKFSNDIAGEWGQTIPFWAKNKKGWTLDVMASRLRDEDGLPVKDGRDLLDKIRSGAYVEGEDAIVERPGEAVYEQAHADKSADFDEFQQQSIQAGRLSLGDKFKIRGEEFHVEEESPTKIRIKDGIEKEVPVDQILEIDRGEVSPGEAIGWKDIISRPSEVISTEIAGEKIKGKAEPLSDGTEVFETESGKFVTRDGRELDTEAILKSETKENFPKPAEAPDVEARAEPALKVEGEGPVEESATGKKYRENYKSIKELPFPIPEDVKVMDKTDAHGEVYEQAYEWTVNLDDGSEVKVNWQPDSIGGMDHLEFSGKAISETGYRSDFVKSGDFDSFQEVKDSVNELIERRRAETMDSLAAKEKRANREANKKKKLAPEPTAEDVLAEQPTTEGPKPPTTEQGKGGRKISYDQFKKEYQDNFEKANKYAPDQVGSQVFTEKMAKLADEHPDFLERFETEIEAEQAKEPSKPDLMKQAEGKVNKEGYADTPLREIGKNSDGLRLIEDKNGVRSFFKENGIRVTEPVLLIPGRGGVSGSVDVSNRRDEWKTTEETNAKQQSAPAESVEQGKIQGLQIGNALVTGDELAAITDQYARKGAGVFLGKTRDFDKTHRQMMGKKLWEDMTPEERSTELRDTILEDFKVASLEGKDNPVDYLLDRALDPLDPLSEVYKLILKKAGATITEQGGIKLTPEMEANRLSASAQQIEKGKAAEITAPEFRDWRFRRTAINSGNIVPNRIGVKFSQEEVDSILSWARGNGFHATGSNTGIHVTDPSTRYLDLDKLGARGVKSEKLEEERQADKEIRESQKTEREAEAGLRVSSDWIDSVFGKEFANSFNRLELSKFLEGETKKFGGLVSPKWLDGLKKVNALTPDGKGVDWAKLKKAYQSENVPTEEPPVTVTEKVKGAAHEQVVEPRLLGQAKAPSGGVKGGENTTVQQQLETLKEALNRDLGEQRQLKAQAEKIDIGTRGKDRLMKLAKSIAAAKGQIAKLESQTSAFDALPPEEAPGLFDQPKEEPTKKQGETDAVEPAKAVEASATEAAPVDEPTGQISDNKARTIRNLGDVGTKVQYDVPSFNKDTFTITDIENEFGKVSFDNGKTYHNSTEFKTVATEKPAEAGRSFNFASKEEASKWMRDNGIEKAKLSKLDTELYRLDVEGDKPVDPPMGWYLDVDNKPRWTNQNDPDNGFGLNGPYTANYMRDNFSNAELADAKSRAKQEEAKPVDSTAKVEQIPSEQAKPTEATPSQVTREEGIKKADQLEIGDIVKYDGKEYAVGFVKHYATSKEDPGWIRLQNPTDSTKDQVKVQADEVTFVRKPAEAKDAEPKAAEGFAKGDRVVINDSGRHGEIVEANRYVMQDIYGRKSNASTVYYVKTDNGTKVFVSGDKDMTQETERPTEVIPDIKYDGDYLQPESLYANSDYAFQNIRKKQEAMRRARTSVSKQLHKIDADKASWEYHKKRTAWEEWAKQHPEEAAKIREANPASWDKEAKFKQAPAEQGVTGEPAVSGLEYDTFKHTKTRNTMHVVKVVNRVSDSVFKGLRNAAKELGGYYSNFKGGGAIPGFIFKTQEDAIEFIKAASPRREATKPLDIEPIITNLPSESIKGAIHGTEESRSHIGNTSAAGEAGLRPPRDTERGKPAGEGGAGERIIRRSGERDDTAVLGDASATRENLRGPAISPEPMGMEGQRAVDHSGEGISRHSDNMVVSEPARHDARSERSSLAENFSLEHAAPVSLTKGDRRETNERVRRLLKEKPLDQLTDADKDLLRQYTGEGGLSPGTYEALNQHFTDYNTIRSIYDALDNAGLKFKDALEPAVGAGSFVGNRPNLKWTTVDIDPTNHQVVKTLYPQGTHYLMSFEDYKGKTHDLIVSNVPFSEERGSGKLRNRGDVKTLHDFYFVHALDLVKENGVVPFITSHFTMDKVNSKIREEIVSRADIIGAFRLPQGHFSETAHTDVTTDIIFMQKRPEGVEPSAEQREINEAFVRSTPRPGEEGLGIRLSDYYKMFPQNILGDLSVGQNKMYGGEPVYVVTGDADLSKIAIDYQSYEKAGLHPKAEIIEDRGGVPSNYSTFKDWKLPKGTVVRRNLQVSEVMAGTVHKNKILDEGFSENIFIKNGDIYAKDKELSFGDVDGKVKIYNEVTGPVADKIKLLNAINDTAIQFQESGDRDIADTGESLIADYQKEFGAYPRNDPELKDFFKKAGEKTLFAEYNALFDEQFNPSPVFQTRTRWIGSGKAVVDENSPIEHRAFASEDPQGQFKISDSHVNFDELSNAVKAGYSIVDLTKTDATLQNNVLYDSGNIYQKIRNIDGLLETLPKNNPHREQLEAQRERLDLIKREGATIDDIRFKGSESWLFPHLKAHLQDFGISMEVDSKTGKRYYTHRDPVYANYLNNDALIKRLNNDDIEEPLGSYLARLRQAEESVLETTDGIRNKIKENPQLLKDIEYTFNSKFKSYVKPDYAKAQYLVQDVLNEIREKSTIKLRKNQIEWFVKSFYEGRGINAHDVGGGKTFAAIALVRALKKRGIANKTMIAVPAKTITKWERDIKKLFPDANVVNLGKLGKDVRTQKLFELANNNADYVLISHEGFDQIKLSKDKELQYIDAVVREHLDDPEAKGRQVATLMEKIDRLRETIKNSKRDPRLVWDKLGVDGLVVDEAHNFKNIGIRGELNKYGIGIGFGVNEAEDGTMRIKSERSYDMRFKANYISETNNGKNVFLLTATPTPNKPMEIYTMLRHLSPDVFADYGIESDRDFANTFFDLKEAQEPGAPKTKKILDHIKNAVELRAIMDRFIDKLSMEQMPWIKIPGLKEKRHILKISDAGALIVEDLGDRRMNLPPGWGPHQPGDDTIIAIFTTGRAGSVDPRLYRSDHAKVTVDSRSFNVDDDKMEYAITQVADLHKKNPKGGQLIFMDASGHELVERGKLPENLHREIKAELMKRGLKANQIGIINGKEITNPKTWRESAVAGDAADIRKQELADLYNEGKVKVLIGTTQSMGEGMDLQIKTTDIWHMDIPFTPGAIRQRNGRGVRYGNENDTVNSHLLLMQGTFDGTSMDIVEHKRGWNEALWDKEVQAEISTKEEMLAGAMPRREQILIALEPDPVRKEILKLGFEGTRMQEERSNLRQMQFMLSGKLRRNEQFMSEHQAFLRDRTKRLTEMKPDEKVKDEKQRQETYEKSRANLEKLIEVSKRKIQETADNKEKIERQRADNNNLFRDNEAKLEEFQRKYLAHSHDGVPVLSPERIAEIRAAAEGDVQFQMGQWSDAFPKAKNFEEAYQLALGSVYMPGEMKSNWTKNETRSALTEFKKQVENVSLENKKIQRLKGLDSEKFNSYIKNYENRIRKEIARFGKQGFKENRPSGISGLGVQDISPEVQAQLHSLQRNPQKVTSEKPSPEWAREYVDLLKKAVQGVEVVRDPREFRRRAAELDRQDARAFFDPQSKKAYFGPEALKDSYGHEFGHAVWIHIKESYPKFYQQGRDLIKGTDYEKNAIAQNYPDPLDEGLVQAIGEKGAKIQDAAVKNRFMAWFRRVWMKANIAMKKLTGKGLTLDEFTNDLALRMRKPGAFKIGGTEEPVQQQFGGIKAKLNVKTTGFSKEAKRMEKEGASREDIWKKTGWWRGPDGKLRFEVDVDKMKFKNWPGIRNFGDAHFEWGKDKKTDLRLSDVLAYPSLFKAYPFLRYLKLSELATTNAFGESTGNKGFYIEDRRTVGIAGNTGEKEARSILLHELQHAIQDREGFALGGSLGVPEVRERAEREIADTLDEANKQLLRLTNQRDEYLKAHKGEKDEIGLVDDFMEQNPEWEKDFDSAFALRRYMSSAVERKIKTQKAYKSLAGEVESRTVQRRLDMKPEERKNEPPWVTTEKMMREERLIKEGQRPEDVLIMRTERGGTEDMQYQKEARGIGTDSEKIKNYLTDSGIVGDKAERYNREIRKDLFDANSMEDKPYAEAEVTLRIFKGTASKDEVSRAFEDKNIISAIIPKIINKEISVSALKGKKIKTPKDFAVLVMPLRNPYFESMKVAYVDKNNKIISAYVTSVGTMTASIVDPSEIISHAPDNVKGIIVSHNHPSGKAEPSSEDIAITNKLKEISKASGLNFIDHIITNGDKYYSFANSMTMPLDKYYPMEQEKIKISRLPRIGGSEDFNKTVQIFRQLGDNSHVIYLSTGSKIYAVERLVSDSVPDIKKSILRNAKKFGSNAVLLDLPNYPSNKEFTFLDDFADITGSGITILDVSTKGSKSWVYDGKLNSIRESSSGYVLDKGKKTSYIQSNEEVQKANGISYNRLQAGNPETESNISGIRDNSEKIIPLKSPQFQTESTMRTERGKAEDVQYQVDPLIARATELYRKSGTDNQDDFRRYLLKSGENPEFVMEASRKFEQIKEAANRSEEAPGLAVPAKPPPSIGTGPKTAAPAPAGPATGATTRRYQYPQDPSKLQEIGEKFKNISNEFRSIAAPAGMGKAAVETASIAKHRLAHMEHTNNKIENALQTAGKFFEKQDKTFNYDFINDIETGNYADMPPELKGFAEDMNFIMNHLATEVQNLGEGKLQDLIRNYFPHVWKNPEKAQKVIQDYIGKRPMEGPKGFLKRRTLMSTREGLEAGLKPISDNPVDLILYKAHEMTKYLAAHRIGQEMKESGLLQFARGRGPEGWTRLDDKYFTVFGNPKITVNMEKVLEGTNVDPTEVPEDVMVNAGGMIIRGNYYAPKEAARIINNYLSPGLRDKSTAFRSYLTLGNSLNAAQLGFSAFHLGFTSIDATVSKFGLGLIKLTHGNAKGLGDIATSLVPLAAPIQSAIHGHRMLKAWDNPRMADLATQRLLDAYVKGGGTGRMDSLYKTNITRNMMRAFREGTAWGALKGIARIPFAAIEQTARPVMEYVVPRQKLGVAYDLIKMELDRKPDMNLAEQREVFGKVVKSVENRMGQLRYDNLFWNKVTKDLAMATGRSVGWNLGSWREFIGGAYDIGAQAVKLAKGETPEMTYRMSYLVALPVITGLLGAITQYLYTGEAPKDLKDLYFPRTGQLDENGDPQRVALPSYMKDLYHYVENPKQTITNKVHPAVGVIAEMLENRDFYGTEIRNQDDAFYKQLADVGKHMAKSYVPLGVRNAQKQRELGVPLFEKLQPFIGIVNAPMSVNRTKAETMLREFKTEQMPKGTRTRDEAELGKERAKLRRLIAMNRPEKAAAIREAMESGKFTVKDIARIRNEAKVPYLQRGIQTLPLYESLKVFKAANDKEKATIRPALRRKIINARKSYSREEWKAVKPLFDGLRSQIYN